MTRVTMMTGGLIALMALSGCGGGDRINVREIVGVDKNLPDQFAVIRNRPLEAPPSYSTLPPPDPNARNRATIDPIQEARAALGAGVAQTSAAPSSAEQALIAAAGPAPADIRAITTGEAENTRERGYVLERVFPGLRRARQVRAGEVLNPLEELERTNGAPVTDRTTRTATLPAVTAPAAVEPSPLASTVPDTVYVPAPVYVEDLPAPVYVDDLPAATTPVSSGPFPE